LINPYLKSLELGMFLDSEFCFEYWNIWNIPNDVSLRCSLDMNLICLCRSYLKVVLYNNFIGPEF
jgi:hypothetical protein